jgi:hypothetical protein
MQSAVGFLIVHGIGSRSELGVLTLQALVRHCAGRPTARHRRGDQPDLLRRQRRQPKRDAVEAAGASGEDDRQGRESHGGLLQGRRQHSLLHHHHRQILD